VEAPTSFSRIGLVRGCFSSQKMKKFPLRFSRRGEQNAIWREASADWRHARSDRLACSPTGRLHSVLRRLAWFAQCLAFCTFCPRRALVVPRLRAVCSPTKVRSCFVFLSLVTTPRMFCCRLLSAIKTMSAVTDTSHVLLAGASRGRRIPKICFWGVSLHWKMIRGLTLSRWLDRRGRKDISRLLCLVI